MAVEGILRVIDTSIFIEHLRAADKSSTALARIPDGTRLCLSTVTLYELLIGATTAAKRQDVQILTGDLIRLPLTQHVAEEAARLFRELRIRNLVIGHRDLFIAATALLHGEPLLTHNQKHFSRIPGLPLV